MRKYYLPIILLSLLLLFLAGCDSEERHITVGFIYSGSISDQGVNQAQDNARQALVESMDGAVQTIVKESVSAENISTVIYDMVNSGATLIFISDNQWQAQVEEAARQYSDVYFVVYNGTATADNIQNYSARTYEADYLCGVLAASTSANKMVGYLALDNSPANLEHINAFALGVMSVDPAITVDVDFTGSLTRSRLNAGISKLTFNGCDVIGSCLPNNTALVEAVSRGVKVIGNTTAGLLDEQLCITAVTLDLESFYQQEVEKVLAGQFDNSRYVGTIADGFVRLSDYSVEVSQGAIDATEDAKEEIVKGNLAVFTGPITDGAGNVIAQEGQMLSEADLAAMNYTVSNVRVLD